MTDTPTDTAPEAITQADREAAHALVLSYFCDDWKGLLRGEEDGHSFVQAFARHRRLTAHSAGEGLREAWRRVPVEADDAMATAAAAELQRQTAYFGWEPTAIWSAMLGAAPASPPAPPSGAGSITPSGGEGVLAEREACARIADELADDPQGIAAKIASRIRNRTRQEGFIAHDATTPSPDASPDSDLARVRAANPVAKNDCPGCHGLGTVLLSGHAEMQLCRVPGCPALERAR